jgi:hypothetical protein
MAAAATPHRRPAAPASAPAAVQGAALLHPAGHPHPPPPPHPPRPRPRPTLPPSPALPCCILPSPPPRPPAADLRARAPVHVGQPYFAAEAWNLGERKGAETVTLGTNEMPVHGHLVNSIQIDPGDFVIQNRSQIAAAAPGAFAHNHGTTVTPGSVTQPGQHTHAFSVGNHIHAFSPAAGVNQVCREESVGRSRRRAQRARGCAGRGADRSEKLPAPTRLSDAAPHGAPSRSASLASF